MDTSKDKTEAETDFPPRKSGAEQSAPSQRFPYPDLEKDYPFFLHQPETQTAPLLQSTVQEEMDAQAPLVHRGSDGQQKAKRQEETAKWQQPMAKVQFANRDEQAKQRPSHASSADRRRSSAVRRYSVSKRRHSRRYSVTAQHTVGGKVCAVWRNIYTILSLREWLALAVLVGYAILGGVIFSWLEQENTRETKAKLKEVLLEDREKLGDQIISIMNEPWLYSGITDQRRAVVSLLEKYQNDKALGPKAKPKWDIWDGIFYSVTIFTTIGYGHYTPQTKLGRLATILYALIGIPLLLAILADFGRILTRVLKRMWSYLRNGIRRVLAMRRFKNIQQAAHKAGLDFEEDSDGVDGISAEDEEFNFPIPLAVFLIVSWLFICSAFFLIWETGWSYFEAFYFFFISLSTIGLGDIVPQHQKYMMLNFPLVLIGLSLVTLVINLIQNKIEEMKEKAENALEDQLGLEDTETASEGQQTDDELGGRAVWPQPHDGDTTEPSTPADPSPGPRYPDKQGRGKHTTKDKPKGRVNLGIIQTFKLPKRRRRIGTQTEDSFIRDVKLRDRKGRPASDRSSLITITGNSEYFDAASLAN